MRGQLDSLGATDTKVTVTSDLDEYQIAALGAAPVDSYGVGTRLVTGSGIPTAALVYKLVEHEGPDGCRVPVAKKSSSKATVGGKKWAGRIRNEEGYSSEEVLVMADCEEDALAELKERGARPLQVTYVKDGVIDESFMGAQALQDAAERHIASRNELPYQAWRLSEGDPAITTTYVDISTKC